MLWIENEILFLGEKNKYLREGNKSIGFKIGEIGFLFYYSCNVCRDFVLGNRNIYYVYVYVVSVSLCMLEIFFKSLF